MTKLRLYDNTRLSDHDTCNRKFYLRHVQHFVPDSPGIALAFGSAWHAAMDIVWQAMREYDDATLVEIAYEAFLQEWVDNWSLPTMEQATDEDKDKLGNRNDKTALNMLSNYIPQRRRFISDCEIIAIEMPFAVPLDPNDPTLFYVGRIDKVVKWEGRIWGLDHKTTSLYKKDGFFRSDFVDSFSPNSQMDGYMHALRMKYGESAKGFLIDAALVHKTVHNGFMFIPIERALAQMNAWLWEAHQKIEKVEHNKALLEHQREANEHRDFLAAFPKNTSACGHYGGCPYMYLCKVVANPDALEHVPDGYRKEKWEPFEELGLEDIFGDQEHD